MFLESLNCEYFFKIIYVVYKNSKLTKKSRFFRSFKRYIWHKNQSENGGVIKESPPKNIIHRKRLPKVAPQHKWGTVKERLAHLTHPASKEQLSCSCLEPTLVVVLSLLTTSKAGLPTTKM